MTKRSRRLALTTLMATASVNLVACSEGTPEPLAWDRSAPAAAEAVDALAYGSLEACKAADEAPDADCETGWRTAQAEHEAGAPRYGDKAACEAEYGEGRCETRTGGGFFTPFVAGMVLGQVMGGGRRGYVGAPLYRDRLGQVSTAAGGPGALSRNPRTGRLQVARGALAPAPALRQAPARTTDNRAVSRGGFRSTRSYAGGRGFGG